MLFLEFVLFGVGSGVAAQPELLDEVLPLFVGVQLLEGLAFLVGDDIGDVFIQPLLVGRLQLFLELLLFPLPLLLRHRFRDRLALFARGVAFLLLVICDGLADNTGQTQYRHGTRYHEEISFHR